MTRPYLLVLEENEALRNTLRQAIALDILVTRLSDPETSMSDDMEKLRTRDVISALAEKRPLARQGRPFSYPPLGKAQ